jgi:TM2 domain-containing membrane protein YozV
LSAEWYYIGHYGQLGPLTREQVDELIESGVIAPETYVWHSGMTDWLPARQILDLQSGFRQPDPLGVPPPPPTSDRQESPNPLHRPYGSGFELQAAGAHHLSYGRLRSDKSRTLAGVLNLLIPGAGRLYLGYAAYGILQFTLTLFTCGILYLWSFIDGIIILAGGVRMDGYGRTLSD